jgi:peptidoglycan/LPS O-acetylase OafA/YrhL
LAAVLVIVLAVGWWRAGPGGVRNLWLGALTVSAYIGNFRAVHPAGMPLLSHLWSLSLEEQFYLTWPPILWLALRRGMALPRLTKWLLATAFLVAANCFAEYLAGASRLRLADLPDTHSAGLLLGCALALWLADHRICERHRGRFQVAAVCLVVATPLFFLTAQFESSLPFTWGYTAVSLLTVVLLIERICFPTRLLDLIFQPRWAVWLGQRSYEFYLLHYPVLVMLQRAELGTLSRFLIGLPVTIVLGALVHELWQPVQLGLRRRLDARRAPPPHVAPVSLAGQHRRVPGSLRRSVGHPRVISLLDVRERSPADELVSSESPPS